MSAGTPYIGSKISLISKAEIRYQGTLYQVDTKEATVTLAKVRSFGTEDRPVPKPIPPRNETYEFIIFRGSDIKDLHVSEVPKSEQEDATPQDPAIVSATHTPQPQSSPSIAPVSQPSAHPSHPRPPTYNPFPPPNLYSPFGLPYVRPPIMMGARGTQPSAHPPPMHPSHGHPAHAVPIHQQQQHPQPGGPHPPEQPHMQPPRQGDNQPRGTPVSLPVQVQSLAMTSQQPLISGTSQPYTTSSVASGVPVSATPAPAPPSSETEPQASSTPRVANAETTPKASLPLESESPGLPKTTVAQPPVPAGGQHIQPPPSTRGQETTRDNHPQVDSTTPHGYTQDRPESSVRNKRPEDPSQRGGRRDRNHNNQYGRQYEGRGGYRGYNRRGSRGYFRGPPRGGSYPSQHQHRPPRGGASGGNGPVYRYDSEFDFESANARFNKEVFEEEFKQLHVDDKSETRSRRTSDSNGDDESVHPAVVSSELDNEVESEEDEFYDKSKSFFDSISCDTSAQGSNRRPTRHAERATNTETFGVSNVRGYNRYRGRGRGRGRGYYGGRGGYRYYSGGNYGNRREQGSGDRGGHYGNRKDQGSGDRSGNYGNRRDHGNDDRSGNYSNRRDHGNDDRSGNYGNRRDQREGDRSKPTTTRQD